jgi:nicotinamide-nucleotide amidase
VITAELLSIGDELLIGQVVNTNVNYISEQLNAIGIDVARITTIGDNKKVITQAIERAWKENRIVIATGGLGPTHDDISKVVVAEYFKKKLVLHKPTLKRVEARFKKFGYKKMPEANISQAMIPQGFTVLDNDKGTAPGLLFHHTRKTFVILPGVPQEMKHLMDVKVIPLLRTIHKQQLGEAIIHRTLLTSGVGESLLAERIGDINTILEKGATLAFLPKTTGVRLRISVRSSNEKTAKQIVARVERRIRSKVDSHIYGTNDETLEIVVAKLLTKHNASISAAESCTGGMLSMRFTSIPGISKHFPGSIVSYSNDIKKLELKVKPSILKAHGAVSEECAIAMAEGIRKKFDTDYALSITGIAGPDGGTKEKPVGTVWIALADREKTVAKVFRFGGERTAVQERSTDAALEMLRKQLLNI